MPHGGIWLMELPKFAAERIETEQQRWFKFFQEGERLDEARLPDWMQTDEMRQAMETLKRFSEKERQYHAYQARQNYLREQSCIQKELEEHRREREKFQRELKAERQQREEERRQKEAALAEKEAALAEVERLKALLVKK